MRAVESEAMSAFGQPPVFGAQAFSTDATTTNPSPFGAPSSQQPAFGAPATFGAAPSNNGGFLGSQDSTASGAAMGNNPFAAAAAATAPPTFAAAAANPFTTLNASSSPNPFAGTAPVSTARGDSPAPNPFASAGFASPFNAPSNAANGAPNTSNNGSSPFANASLGAQKRKNAFEDKADSKRWGSNANAKSQPKASAGFGGNDTDNNHRNGFEDHLRDKTSLGFGASAAPGQQAMVLKGQKKSPSLYAKEIHDQLRKDNIKPPPWPKDPGDPSNLKAMDDYRVRYKKYEARVRTCLIKAGLIDDPDVRKKLSDAIDFRGICEDMCPEGEKVSRIVEHDVKQPEKTQTFGKEQGWADPKLMVKTFKRSAAGTDSPLPTEVRSPAALRRTLDYLIDDLLKNEGNLRDLHGFLWDRTRAIRKDFIFQNAMTAEERIDQIYCLENITRFHAVSLHLLSKEGAASDGFSEQQEREQLGKTLLSLMQVYDECKDMEITIENEAEFRAYYLLFNAHDPFVIQQMQDWNDAFWFDSPEIQTVVTLIEAMQNVWNGRGPLRPAAPLTTGSASFTSYFAIVEDANVSYTMACLAEIHFTEIRRRILKSIHKAYGRVRDGPKDLTAKVLNDMFRFDTEDECVAFLEELDMEFSSDGASEPYLIVERRRGIPGKTVKQSFSQAMVERKRGSHTLPEVVHNTVFEEASSATTKAAGSPDGLFVAQSPDTPRGAFKQQTAPMDVSFSDDESPSSTPVPARRALGLLPTSSLANGMTPSDDFNKFTQNTSSDNSSPFLPPASNPFFSQAPTATAPTPDPFPPAPRSPTPVLNVNSTRSLWSIPPIVDSDLEQISKATPAFSFGATSTPAPPSSTPAASGGIFDFLSKAADKPASFPSTVNNTSAAPSNIFSAKPPTAASNETTEASTLFASKTKSATNDTQIAPNPAPFTPSVSGATEPTPVSSLFGSKPPVSTAPAAGAAPAPDASSVGQFSTTSLAPLQSSTPSPARPPEAPPSPPRDAMLDFAKWMLLGDDGLMDKLQEKLVESLTRQAYEQYQTEEHERKRNEEEERSRAQARKFRKYSLRVKFFYRWRDIARKRSLKRVGRQNREALKAYREAKAAEARAARAKKQKEEQARLKRVTGPASWLDELDKERALKRARRESMSLDNTSRRSSPNSDAEALLATGIFSGMPNQQTAAEQCVRDDDSIYEALVGVHISPNSKRQVMGPPAKPNKDPLRTVRDAGISKLLPKQKLSKKAQYLAELVHGKNNKDDDLVSFKSSTSSSRLGQSTRTNGSITNFMKYQSSSPRSSVDPEKPRNGPSSGIKTPYWRLRSRGLFATPTGHVLSDKVPRPRTDSFYDGASQYSGDSEIGDYNDRMLEQDGAYRAIGMGLNASRQSSFSVASARSPPRPSIEALNPTSFRQSLPAGTSSSMMLGRHHKADGDTASQAGSAMSLSLQEDVEETLRELRKVAAEMDEDTNWYREQNKNLSQGHHVGG